jgi:hypothetical protein
LDATEEQAGATTRHISFYLGGTPAQPNNALRLGTIRVPLSLAQMSDKHFALILREMERQSGSDFYSGYIAQQLKCWPSETRPLMGECSGNVMKGHDSLNLLMYFWPTAERMILVMFLHRDPYDSMANEFNEILASVVNSN